MKYRTLEEQFHTQHKSHESREIELLKTIDSLKNEVGSRDSTIDDLQSNVETLEGAVQVLNQQVACQSDKLGKTKAVTDEKVRLVGKSKITTLRTNKITCDLGLCYNCVTITCSLIVVSYLSPLDFDNFRDKKGEEM